MAKKAQNLITIPLDVIKQYVVELKPGAEDFDTAKNMFIRHVRLKNLRDETIKWYNFVIIKFKDYLIEKEYPLSPLVIKREYIEDYLLYCRDLLGNLPSAINTKIRGLKAFFNYLYNENFIADNPIKGISYFETVEKMKPRFRPDHLKLLFKQPNLQTYTGYRDYIIMLLMLDAGPRLNEVLSIKIEDIVIIEGMPTEIIIRKPKGKGERIIPLSIKMQTALKNYLIIRETTFPGFINSYLFLSIFYEKVNSRTIQERIQRYGKMAGITDVRVSAHTFRHTFASVWVSEGGDIFSLQEILGHSTLDMVKIYAKQNNKDVRRKHSMYSPLNTQF